MCFLLLIIPALVLVPSIAYAQPLHIGIQLSNTCITMLEEGFDTACPNYDQIMAIHPDTTIQEISGKFQTIDGMTKRDSSPMKNSLRFYDYSKENIIWVDPPGDVAERIKLIVIHPSLPEYKLPTSYSMVHNVIYTAQDRWINEKCNKAAISAEKWPTLSGDTIKLLKNDCDYSYSSFNHIKETKFQKTIFDISTSYKWKLDQWIKNAKAECLTLCREY